MKPSKSFYEILRDILSSPRPPKSRLKWRLKGDGVCLLKKALCGFRQKLVLQTLRETEQDWSNCCGVWFMYFSHGFRVRRNINSCLCRWSRNKKKRTEIGRKLSSYFEIREFGNLKHFLEVEQFNQINGKVTVHQRGYINDLLASLQELLFIWLWMHCLIFHLRWVDLDNFVIVITWSTVE